MKWHQRTKWYSILKKRDETIPDESTYILSLSNNWLRVQFAAEHTWSQGRRPFYNVWPSVAAGLSRMTLSIKCSQLVPLAVSLPFAISVQFPVGGELRAGNHRIREFLACRIPMVGNRFGIGIWCDSGEKDRNFPEIPIYWISQFFMDGGGSVEDAVQAVGNAGLSESESIAVEACIRVFCGIALIANDPDFVEPVVIQADKDKYRKTGDYKYVEKAIRRGVLGFDVGEGISISPHFRSPHFAIRWTGRGRSIPKVVPVKGCVVRRRGIADVPTGYLDDGHGEGRRDAT